MYLSSPSHLWPTLALVFFLFTCPSYSDRMLFPQYEGGFVASARSWPANSGSVAFPAASKATTNAGQLAYQVQDAKRQEAQVQRQQQQESNARPAKSVVFRDPEQQATASNVRSKPAEVHHDSGFRPSPAVPFIAADVPLPKRENTVYTNQATEDRVSTTQEAPAKTARYVPLIEWNEQNQEDDSIQSIASITDESGQSEGMSEITDVVDAMEHLVEKINELEARLAESEAQRLAEQELYGRTVAKDVDAQLNAIKAQMTSDFGALTERASKLEIRLSTLEELTREWINPDDFTYDSNGHPASWISHCPEPFISLDTVPNSPCYHISKIPNYRKNWQDAAEDCRRLGAKLAEPQTANDLQQLTDYLRDQRTDQLGGGYWTGGINPGVLWLWPVSGNSLTNIAPGQWMTPTKDSEADNGKCLRLSYDRMLQRYALQSSDCQRYLYFICEYDFSAAKRPEVQYRAEPEEPATAPPPLPTPMPMRSTARTYTKPTTTTTVRPVRVNTVRTRPTTARPSTPPTPNYVGVIGFKEGSQKPINHTSVEELNLAILADNF